MAVRTKDWFRQGEKDLDHARKSVTNADFEWACFAAQQAAGKTVKALYQSVHIDVVDHSVSRMMRNLPQNLEAPEDLINCAKELDRHYIPSRYPNSHPEGAPLDYYTEQDARTAVEGAERIVGFCKDKIPKDQLQ